MNAWVEGTSVLITGAASGIGLCTAEEFAKAGCRLVLVDVDVDAEALEKAAARMRGHGAEVHAYRLDIADRAKFGGLDILINNAGIGAQYDGACW